MLGLIYQVTRRLTCLELNDKKFISPHISRYTLTSHNSDSTTDSTATKQTIYSIMSPSSKEAFQANPVGASDDANERFFVAGGDSEEGKDHRIEEKASSIFKSALLSGLILFFLSQIFILGAI